MFFEGVDNDHGRTTGAAEVGTGSWVIVSGFCFRCIDTRVIDTSAIGTVIAEELTQPLNLFDANVVGKQSVVTDAMKAWRQHMDEKSSHKLVGGECQGFESIRPLGTIVFPLEGDAAFIVIDEPAVTDGDPMSVSREVGEHRFGSGERTLGIDHPVDLA